MTRTVEAIYSGGVLKPVSPLEGIQENGRVTVTVSEIPAEHPFADWVGGVADVDAAEMIRAIDEEFERIEPNDWK